MTEQKNNTPVKTLSSIVGIAKAKNAKSGGSSDKNPAYYQRRKGDLIDAMLNHENQVVRLETCKQKLVPMTKLQLRLRIEEDAQVIKAILMNPALPAKSIMEFASDPRADLVAGDEELERYVMDKLSA